MTVVLGASGQLGSELKRIVPAGAIFADENKIDFTDIDGLTTAVREMKPTLLINAAAYTAVDNAESERELAFKVNCAAPRRLAELAGDMKFKFIHVSTDYVFNGQSASPYEEFQDTDPLNVYGESKAEGEKGVIEACPESLIVRTSWVYSASGKNFVKTVLRVAAEKKGMNVVNDQIGSPTWAADLAKILMLGKDLTGIYHYTNEGVASWYDVACAIKYIRKLDFPLFPILSDDYPTPARRPRMSLLNKSKIKNSLGIQIPHWMESLEKCLKELPA